MAMDLAIVSGLTGTMWVSPRLNAVATGEHPSACAPVSRGMRAPSPCTRPRSISSRAALLCLTNWQPLAMGMTISSGSRQPSCSAVSKVSVFDPSL